MNKYFQKTFKKFARLNAGQKEQLSQLNHSGEQGGSIKLPKKKIIITSLIVVALVGGFFAVSYGIKNKRVLVISSLSALNSVSKFLPISQDEKKEIEVLNAIVTEFTKKDDQEKNFLIMLQNEAELRPGGGFLGQYAIVKIKNGEVISTFIEDANLLDQRISAKIPAPFPFKRMMQIKNWKFRDSNFSPDFPTNVEKAKYFFRLAGRSSSGFDGVIAVNSEVFDNVIGLTGPITVPGYSGEYTKENASRKLEEQVEKAYIMNPEIDTQNRKAILKKMAPIILDKLLTLGNITKVADLFHNELKNRNVMLNFSDSNLQKLAESVHWDGTMPKDWDGDYLMAVDANMGALKSDFYIKREMIYDIDLTQPKPLVTLNIKYRHTAPYGDWRTSDYHSYLRVYAPQGSNFLESNMVSHLNTNNEFGKTYFGFMCHVLIGQETNATIKYELPESFSNIADYKLLIQKQSGAGDVPITVNVKTKDEQYSQQQNLANDLRFEYEK
ncbi:MAG: hypothetical protein US70_C0019G0009 [Parcubacteria group bacterium GW2011_GWD2_38_11]|nr:MAG: hypothetical protein US70_C0019G0009 [Parcubacteria group bacterium GW2011_GWD2_38_11]